MHLYVYNVRLAPRAWGLLKEGEEKIVRARGKGSVLRDYVS